VSVGEAAFLVLKHLGLKAGQTLLILGAGGSVGTIAVPADRAPEALPEVAALLAGGRLAVPIWRTYPLAQAAQAHADLEARRNHGKVVLLP